MALRRIQNGFAFERFDLAAVELEGNGPGGDFR